MVHFIFKFITLSVHWRSLEPKTNSMAMSIPRLQTVVSKHYFPLKGTKIPWRNGWFLDGAGTVQNAPRLACYTRNQVSYQRLPIISEACKSQHEKAPLAKAETILSIDKDNSLNGLKYIKYVKFSEFTVIFF